MAGQFEEALIAFSERQPKGRPWNTNAWSMESAEVRQKSFWSARVENVRFLERGKGLIDDFLNEATEEVNGETVFKVGSRADFVRKMREFQLAEGMVKDASEFQTGADENVADVAMRGRLNLIFDTNVRSAYGYGKYKQGMNPVVLASWPAWRFVRLPGSEEKRPRHAAGEGDVRLKIDDQYWAGWQNNKDIGGFGVPYPPFGFNSSMDVEPVSRREAERLGLIQPGQRIAPVSRRPNEETKSSLKNISPELKKKLRDALNKHKRKKEKRHETPENLAVRKAKEARVSAIMGSLDAARNKGDRKEVSRIATILREEMTPELFDRRFNYRMSGEDVELL